MPDVPTTMPQHGLVVHEWSPEIDMTIVIDADQRTRPAASLLMSAVYRVAD